MVARAVDAIPGSSGTPESPTASFLRGAPAFADAMWRVLNEDVLTAFRVATSAGRILHASEASMGMLLRTRGTGNPRDSIGKYWHDFLPAQMVRERLEVARQALRDGRARYLRSIYHGEQVVTRYDPVGAVEGVQGGAPLVICTTRQEPRVLAGEAPADTDIIEPEHHLMGPLSGLSSREVEVLALIAGGLSIQEIAQWIGRSVHTVNDIRRSIGRKLQAEDRVELAHIARRAGLTFTDGRLRSADAKPSDGDAKDAVDRFDRSPVATEEELRRVLLGSPAFVRALWGTIFEDVFSGAQVVSRDTTLLFANQQMATMVLGHGVRPEHCVGRRWSDLAPPELVAGRVRVLERVLRTGRARMTRGIHLGVQVVSRFERCDPMAGLGGGEPLALIVARRVPQEVLDRLPAKHRALVEMPRVQRLGRLASLSRRELEVLALIGAGLSNKQIAQKLHRTEDTIEDHRNSMGKKLGVDDRVQLAAIARRAGLRLEDAGDASV